MSGKLIVIEGLDGSGKATQTSRLCEYLQESNITFRRLGFPNYESPSSSLVKMYLNGDFSKSPEGVNAYAASAFYAVDRCAGFLCDYKNDYDDGKLLIADRYATSNIIYQMSKLPKSGWDSFISWTEDFEYNKLGIPKPNMVIYLDMNVGVSQKLLSLRYNGDDSKKDIHESNSDFLTQCRQSALYAAERLGWRVISCDDGKAPRSIDDIAQQIRNTIKDFL